MSHTRRSPSANENWIKEETLINYKNRANRESEKNKIREADELAKGKKQITIPHPTSPRAVIIKFIYPCKGKENINTKTHQR